jgi:hypothetical protein
MKIRLATVVADVDVDPGFLVRIKTRRSSAPQAAPNRRTNHNIQFLICSLIIAACPLLGEVQMQVRDGHPVVDGVYVNGHGPYRFLLDTGSNVNLIETNLAKSIGLTAGFRTELASSTGVTEVPGCKGTEVSLDSVKAERQEFLFMRLAFHDRWPDVQGLLGQWFLWRFDYMLDLRGKRLAFGKQDPPGLRVPFRMINGRVAVSTNVGELVLDSGAERLVLFGVKPDRGLGDQSEMLTLTGSRKIGKVSSTLLTIEGRRIWRGDAVAISDRAEPEVDGLMPLGLFRKVYVCNSQGYAVFE